MERLSKAERLQLMRVVCAFAWADLEVKRPERQYIAKLAKQLRLSPDELKMVDEWLKVPPPADELDPNRIPRAHRQLFIETAAAVIGVDGQIDPRERENFEMLAHLLG